MTGLILLVFIAAIITFYYVRVRGKLKLPVAGKHWTGAIIVIVILVLMLWANNRGGGK